MWTLSQVFVKDIWEQLQTAASVGEPRVKLPFSKNNSWTGKLILKLLKLGEVKLPSPT